ncbi:MAG: Uma2 family endonuclease [Gammaproteobacteria bacterium]|nr:Uma2 family endonuclease [Gammaproteobacteria bacterium]
MSPPLPSVPDPGAAVSSVRPPAPKAHSQPLSEIHARALYRPLPPVELDDDGYPYSDSLPVESRRHEQARAHLVDVVQARFVGRANVFAASELGFYFERGNRKALVVPDAFVVFGVEANPDLSYKLWEHHRVPDFVMEVLSRHTWRKDVHDKPALYADLGVREYWLFDPYRTRRDGGAVLEGRRLAGRGWAPVAPCATGDGFVSGVLDLDILVAAGELRLRDRETGEIVPNLTESIERNKQSDKRANEEAARADREARKSGLEALRADREAARAETAERRIAELEAQLAERER